jgi:NADH dehydrogenase
MTSTIAIAGATGFLGRHTVRELLSRGHSVRALARDRDKARSVLARDARADLRIVEGDPFSPEALRDLLSGADACINAIGIIREAGGGQTFKRVHVDTTRALVHASQAHHAVRFIQVSALGVHDEGRTKYQQSKWEAEQIVRRSGGLGWTILRPAMIHGPDGEFIRTAAKWCRGKAAPWIFLPYFTRSELTTHEVPLGPMKRIDPQLQPVFVGDVAHAIAECLERDQTIGEVYNLPGSETLTWPQLLRHMRDTLPGGDREIEPRPIPSEIAAKVARAAAISGMGPLLPFDEGMAILGGLDSTATLHKAHAHLAFRPRPFRETFAEYARSVN